MDDIQALVLAHETAIRLAAFAGLLALFVAAEALWPRRARVQPRAPRWTTNLALGLIDAVLVRILVPVLAAGAALWAERQGIGLLNSLPEVAVSGWLRVVAALVALDLVIYVQHRLFHRLTVLWRVHRVHHADRDIDATTALRFHPVEILLSMLVKIAAVVALGAPVVAVVLFEVILNGVAMFNHANLRLPAGLDGALRLVVVTPDMHRVHHSVLPAETDSNFGFNLSLWDRLFRTYRAQPARGHERMTIGLAGCQDDRPMRLGFALALPFVRAGLRQQPEKQPR